MVFADVIHIRRKGGKTLKLLLLLLLPLLLGVLLTGYAVFVEIMREKLQSVSQDRTVAHRTAPRHGTRARSGQPGRRQFAAAGKKGL